MSLCRTCQRYSATAEYNYECDKCKAKKISDEEKSLLERLVKASRAAIDAGNELITEVKNLKQALSLVILQRDSAMAAVQYLEKEIRTMRETGK